jgi:predicted RNA-binding protein with PUA domain
MKKHTFLFIIFLLFSSRGFSQNSSNVLQVLSLSEKKFDWMVKGQTDSLKTLMHKQVKYIHSNGWIQNYNDVTEDFKTGKLVLQSVQVKENQAREFKNMVIVIGKGLFTGSISGQDFSVELLYTEVYIYKKHKWLLVSRHANKL